MLRTDFCRTFNRERIDEPGRAFAGASTNRKNRTSAKRIAKEVDLDDRGLKQKRKISPNPPQARETYIRRNHLRTMSGFCRRTAMVPSALLTCGCLHRPARLPAYALAQQTPLLPGPQLRRRIKRGKRPGKRELWSKSLCKSLESEFINYNYNIK